MQLRYLLAASVASLTFAGLAAAPAVAQETTSAIDGQVTGENGAPFAGAKITVKHVPSGTVITATSDSGGNFSLRGLRVGGPYTVTVEGQGYASETAEGIQLSVGETFALPMQLTTREIVVSAEAIKGGRELNTGSQSAFNSKDISDVVSARRDVRDIMRRDLLAGYNANVGGVSIAGGNIRTQRFSVDGVQMQDSFGLNYGGLPSTRGIVSIEAIDQLTVKAAPFDISEGNFQGGAVNVVLKSGTNTFHGSAFGNFGGPSLNGKLTRDNRGVVTDTYAVGPTAIFNFKNYGGSLSGPIIKDTLFVSLAYEKLTEGWGNTAGPVGSSAPNIIPNLTQATIDDVISRFNGSGYDKYNIGNVPAAIGEVDEKYSGKLDWNITTGQRFSLSYLHHKNVLPNYAAGAGVITGSTSTSTPYIQLQSNLYQLTEMNNAVSGQLNSQWSSNFSSEVRVAYRYYRRGQDAFFGPDYAQMNVCTDPTSAGGLFPASGATLCNTGVPIIRMGPDTPRQANKFDTQQLTIMANAQLRLGNHTIKFEYDRFHSKLYNLFVFGGSSAASGITGGGSGAYYFDSLADFSARTANEFTLTTTTTGDKNDGYVRWGYTTNTIGLQDTWKVSPYLTINAGLRFDIYTADNTIQLNQNFVNRYATLLPGLVNTSTLDGRKKAQPRFGFNWQTTPSLRIAGGVGLFSGGLSDVFISNNYSNSGAAINSTGATITSVDIVRTGGTAAAPTCLERSTNTVLSSTLCSLALSSVGGGTIPQAIIDYVKSNAGVAASALTNFLDPKFKLPAQWKVNLSANWKPDLSSLGLGTGWTFRGDFLYSKAQQAVRWTDLRAQPLVINGVTQLAPDGRPRYGGLVNGAVPGSNYDMELTNTTQGRGIIFAVGINKASDMFDLGLSYTHQNVKDVTGVLTSSTVSSAYGSVPTSDPNSGGDYGRSAFEITHTLRANLEFHHKFFGDNETRFGINVELRSGQPWSATMFDSVSSSATNLSCNVNGLATGRSCVFGTATNANAHLLYVPDFSLSPVNNASTVQGVPGTLTQYGNVIFADAATLASMQSLVSSTVLSKYQGRIAPKNVLTGPWYNKVDLNFAQEIPIFGRLKVTALFSIENFLNLLNRNWGSYQDFGTSANGTNQPVVRVTCQTPAAGSTQTCPAYIYSTYSAPKTTTYSKPSLYAIRLGARIAF